MQTARLQAKRDKTVELLNKIDGIDCQSPTAASMCFPTSVTGMTAQQFADYMIENYQSGSWPSPRSRDRGEGHIRLTYACPTSCLRKASTASARASRTSRPPAGRASRGAPTDNRAGPLALPGIVPRVASDREHDKEAEWLSVCTGKS